MIKRKTFFLLRCLAAALAFAIIAGCGNKGQSPPDKPVLEFWHIQTYDPTGPAIEKAVNRLLAAQPDMAVEIQAIANDPFKTKLTAAMGAGAPPDVFHTWGGGILTAYVDSGRVLDLSPHITDTSRFHPAALDFCTVNDTLYALPVDVTVVPMWINPDLFEKAGVAPPKTLEDLLAACARLRAADITPIALGNAKSWPGAFYFAYLASRFGGTQPIAEQRFDDPAFIAAGEWINKLVAADAFSKGFNGLDADDSYRQFLSGEAAMILMGPWLTAKAKAQAPEMVGKMQCIPFPTAGKNAEWDAIAVGGVNAAYAVAATTKSTANSTKLLQALTDDTAMSEWAQTGRFPALTREAASPMLLPESTAIAEILFAAKTIQLYYDQLLPPALATAHKETTQAIFAAAMTPHEAAQQMLKVKAEDSQ
jgi:raffinose/stachyose/melibiose transport system substrate-binding protein